MKIRRVLFGLIVLVLFAVPAGVVVYFWRLQHEAKPVNLTDSNANEKSLDEEKQEETPSTQQGELKIANFNSSAIQEAINKWGSGLSSTSKASIVILNTDGTEVATLNPDDKYFSASIYKLFVAYAGYQQIDDKKTNSDEQYTQGYTRGECLDLMIRESYSPCAEKMWNEIGKDELTAQFKSYGLDNTDLVALRTTARDTGKILVRITNSEKLSSDSQALFLDSMKTQDDKYRLGLPNGFSKAITVYNKVGWNEQQEYHDAAIIELADGRRLVVVALTSGVGSANLRKLATALETVLL